MASSEILALVGFYARGGYSRHPQTVCAEVLKKRPGDAVLSLWRAFGVVREGATSEALRALEPCLAARQTELAALALAVQAHRAARVQDDDAIAVLESRADAEEMAAGTEALSTAAAVYYAMGVPGATRDAPRDQESELYTYKANDLADRALDAAENDGGGMANRRTALCVKGWLALRGSGGAKNDGDAGAAASYFQSVLNVNPQDLEARLGLASSCESRSQYEAAIEHLNAVVVHHQWFMPARTEKARLLSVRGDWEQAVELTDSVLAQDKHNIEALQLSALHQLVRVGGYEVAEARLAALAEALRRNEPRNAQLYLAVARPFVRLAGGDPRVLEVCERIVAQGRAIDATSAPIMCEQARLRELSGDLAGAAELYAQAGVENEMNFDTMLGAIRVQIKRGDLDSAASQLEFLEEMQASLGGGGVDNGTDGAGAVPTSAGLLSAMLAWRRGGDVSGAAARLDEAAGLHLRALRGRQTGYAYYTDLDAALLLEMAACYLEGAGSEPRTGSEAVDPLVGKAISLLEVVSKSVPGMLSAQLALGNATFLAGRLDAAHSLCATCLRLNPNHARSQLLAARVALAQGKPRAAAAALEQALSHDFSVRDSPQYALVRAQVLKESGQFDEAARVLKAATLVPGVARGGTDGVSAGESCSLLLLHADVLGTLGKLGEASDVLQGALTLFAGTVQEMRVHISNCELSLHRGDPESALSMLRGIPRASPYYARARAAMAEVYLKHKRDREAYCSCYEDIAEAKPEAPQFIMLGEALMRVQEPERAIAAFERALERAPRDAGLASRVGRALVASHDYGRAVDFYEAACRGEGGAVSMHLELAELYTKLGRFERCDATLKGLMGRVGQGSDPKSIETRVSTIITMGKMLKAAGSASAALEHYKQAQSEQDELVKALRSESGSGSEATDAARERMCDILYCMGQEHEGLRDTAGALQSYQEALKWQEGSPRVLRACARLSMAKGDIDSCQAQCAALLRVNATDEEGSLMLAEIMLQKENYETAVYHYEQLLERSPGHHGALVSLVQTLHRAGRLEEAPKVIASAERNAPRGVRLGGLRYARGLLAQYQNDPAKALKELNAARQDGEWGTHAIYLMVMIYLNPDGSFSAFDAALGDPAAEEVDEGALLAAERLLLEVRGAARKSGKHVVLEAMTLMARRTESDVSAALQRLLEYAQEDAHDVGVLLAIGNAHALLGQLPKARNFLKRIQKMPYSVKHAENFERAWLLLAQVHIEGGKYDLAQELCRRALKYNKSSAQAWEYMGLVMEKELSYADAAEHYENAWKYSSQASPQVGYKLGWNYLKAKRYVDAVNVAHKVLKTFPAYKGIKTDVLDKARAAFKP